MEIAYVIKTILTPIAMVRRTIRPMPKIILCLLLQPQVLARKREKERDQGLVVFPTAEVDLIHLNLVTM